MLYGNLLSQTQKEPLYIITPILQCEKAKPKRWHMIGLPDLIIYILLPSLRVNLRGASGCHISLPMNKSFSRRCQEFKLLVHKVYTYSALVDSVKLTPKISVSVYAKKLSVFRGGDLAQEPQIRSSIPGRTSFQA